MYSPVKQDKVIDQIVWHVCFLKYFVFLTEMPPSGTAAQGPGDWNTLEQITWSNTVS